MEGSILPATERGCGFRVSGGIYAVVPTGPGGKPASAFIVDPPIPLPPGFPVKNRGMSALWVDGPEGRVLHLVDRIGMGFYPTPAHYFEEYARYGVSRRIPRNIPFEHLTPQSRLILVHDLGYVVNHAEFYQAHAEGRITLPPHFCPKHLAPHAPAQLVATPEMCAGLWWRTLDGDPINPPPAVSVKGGEFAFIGWPTPEGITPTYIPAICFKFPIPRLEIVTGGEDFEASMAAASAAKIPVVEVAW